MTLADRIAAYLRSRKAPSTAREIARALNAPTASVRRTLSYDELERFRLSIDLECLYNGGGVRSIRRRCAVTGRLAQTWRAA